MNTVRLRADFNGLFGDVLCLSHEDHALDEHNDRVALSAGLIVTAFDEDLDDDGHRDDLVANGVVEKAPEWLACRGSKWILRIDANGVHHKSEQAR